MNMTMHLTPGSPVAHGGSYRVLQPVVDEVATRRFLERSRDRVAEALADHEARLADHRPYEDALDAAEFRARYGV